MTYGTDSCVDLSIQKENFMKRLISLLITISMLLSLIPSTFAIGDISVTLPTEFVSVGASEKLVITGANSAALSYKSSDKSVLRVKSDGTVVGVSIGRATVTVTADFGEAKRSASVEIPVVGENLLVRNGINHGNFEGGKASLFDERANRFSLTSGFVKAAHFWWCCRETGYAETLEIVTMDTAARKNANVLKYSMTNMPENHEFGMRSAPNANTEAATSNYAYGSIPVESGKLYELSAWANYDNVKNMPALYGRIIYNDANGTSVVSADNSAEIDTEVSGWQRLNTRPIASAKIGETPTYAQMYFGSGRVAANSVTELGDIYVADISFHEVKYDKLVFAFQDATEVTVGATLPTSVKHFSSSGKEILSADNVDVTYASTNENVATVSAGGVITVTGTGTADITATATIGNVTQTSVIPLCVTDENVLASVMLSADGKTAFLGATRALSVSGLLKDGSDADLTSASIVFTSDNTGVLTVDNGVVTPVAIGEANIKAEVTLDGITHIAHLHMCVEKARFVDAELVLPDIVYLGENANAEVLAIMSDETYVPEARVSVQYSSSDDEVLKVTSSGKVTALTAGNAEIIAEVTVDRKTITAKKRINCTQDPDAIGATIKSRVVNVGESVQIMVANADKAESITFESSDENIVRVRKNGALYGVSIGRATVTVIADFGKGVVKKTSLEIPVVGENLLVRNGINHGDFEGGTPSLFIDMVQRLRSTWAKAANCFWWTPLNSEVSGYAESAEVVAGETPTSSDGKMLKYSNTTQQKEHWAIGTSTFHNHAPASYVPGAVLVEKNKLYEFTGHIKFDSGEGFAADFGGNAGIHYFSYTDHTAEGFGSKAEAAKAPGNMTAQTETSVKADNNWKFFSTKPVDMSGYENALDTYMHLRLSGRIAGGWLGDLYLAEASFHEVKYDKLEFELKSSAATLSAGDTLETSVKHLSTSGNEITSVDASGKSRSITVAYASTNAAVATVSDSGVITVTGNGNADITATATIGNVTQTSVIPLCVTDENALAAVTLSADEKTVFIGDSGKLSISGLLKDGSDADLSSANIVFTSDNTDVLTVANSVVTPVAIGEANIKAELTLDGTVRVAYLHMRVENKPAPSLDEVSLIVPENMLLGEIATATLTATMNDDSSASQSEMKVVYASTDDAVVSISRTGKITAHKPGQAEITATVTVGKVTKFVSKLISVTKDPDAIELTFKNKILNVGGTASLVVDGADDAESIALKSSDDHIARINEDGTIVGIGIGRVIITAVADFGDKSKTASIEIPVVGENILNSRGVDHGTFDGGKPSLQSGKMNEFSIADRNLFWWIPAVSPYAEKVGVELRSSAISEFTNVLRVSRETEEAAKQIIVATDRYANMGGQSGGFVIDNSKLYEFTGWINEIEVNNSPGPYIGVFHFFNAGEDTYGNITSTKYAYAEGEGEWKYFNTNPYDLSDISIELTTQPRINSGATAWTGNFYFADFSFHEVGFDELKFEADGKTYGLSVGAELDTTVSALTTTGKEITSFDANGKVKKLPVTYYSDNEAVATVSADGKITVTGNGTTDITASATLGGIKRTSVISICAGDALIPEKAEFVERDIRLTVGENAHTELSLMMSDESYADLSEAEVLYGTENESIASVDAQSGAIIANRKGNTRICATVVYAGITKKAYMNVFVEEKKLSSVRVLPQNFLRPGESCETAIALYATDGTEIAPEDCTVSYKSSNEEVATVNDVGEVTAHMGGAVNITAHVTYNGTTVKGKAQIVVNYLRTVELYAEEKILKPGERLKTKAVMTMYDGTEIPAKDCVITYQSTNEAAAYVDNEGIIRAVGDGVCDITAQVTYNDVTATSNSIRVSVYDGAALESAELYGPSVLLCGSYGSFSISGVLESGQKVDVPLENAELEIISGAEFAEIDGKRLLAKAPGEVSVRAKVTYRGAENLYTEPVTVLTKIGVPEEVLIDFRREYTPITATIAADGWTLNYEFSRNNIADSERNDFYGIRPAFTGSWLGDINQNNELNRFAFDFNIPADGVYSIEMLGAGADNAGPTWIYIDGKYIGDYQHWFDIYSVVLGEPKRMNTIELAAGIHTCLVGLYDNSKSTKGNITYPYVTYLKLTPVDKLPEPEKLEVHTEKIVLAQGENQMLSASLIMDDGSEYLFGADYRKALEYTDGITYESSVPDVFIYDEDSEKIVGLSEGTGELTVTANLGENILTKTVSVTVTDEQLGYVTASVDDKEVFVGDEVKLDVVNTLTGDGRIIDNSSLDITLIPKTPATLEQKDGKIYAIADGDAEIEVISKLGTTEKKYTLSFKVYPSDFSELTLSLSAGRYYVRRDVGNITVIPHALTNLGFELPITGGEASFETSDSDIAEIDPETGTVTIKDIGKVSFTVMVVKNGITRSESVDIEVVEGKLEPTYYTLKERANIAVNAKKYDWAKQTVKSAVKKADQYVGLGEKIADIIPSYTLPRSTTVGAPADDLAYSCHYCGTDLRNEYGLYPWLVNPLIRPWKIQCPDCKRLFPSNDFESFYELGLDENGVFDRELAYKRNNDLIAAGKKGYLVNELYPEKGEGWGVDDGWGYETGEYIQTGNERRFSYIAYYIHDGVWVSAGSNRAFMQSVLPSLGDAYLYTGDKKYGIAGLIILDRIADMYPDFEYNSYGGDYGTADGGSGRGKIAGIIREPTLADLFNESYDIFYPLTSDEEVIRILSDLAKKRGFENPKNTAGLIRQHFEDRLLRETREGIENNLIAGNFGKYQKSMADVAVILDHFPESREMIDWILAPGEQTFYPPKISGGNMLNHLITVIDRDGHPHESPAYNIGQADRLQPAADLIAKYDDYPVANPYKNPKFLSMFDANIHLAKAHGYAQMGDGHYTASVIELVSAAGAASYFMKTGIIELAQYAYDRNGKSVDGLCGSITDEDPEAVQKEILKVIKEYGELDLGSEMLTGFGFSILRSGKLYESVGSNATQDTRKNVWLYWSGNESHNHRDALFLGIEAFGIDMAPEHGYPEQTGFAHANTPQWNGATLSHNTVTVAGETQIRALGTPKQFDDGEKVSVMDIDSSESYSNVDIYRRTVVSVEMDEDTFYLVDFFRILGGDEHIYSFHSQSDEIYNTENLELEKQVDRFGNYKGTYAGIDVPFGPDPTTNYSTGDEKALTYTAGSTWLENVRRAQNVSENFSVDFKVKDFRKILPYQMDLHLKLTMLNDDRMSDVTLATGYPPKRAENKDIPSMEYVLARRKGVDLDSLFTSVYEPYKDESKITEIDSATVEWKGSVKPGKDDIARAVKVNVSENRTDYIVYATNSAVTYTVDGLFDFRGGLGVVSYDSKGNIIYEYINDGTLLADLQVEEQAVVGKVSGFTTEMQVENFIEIETESNISPESLVGRYVYVENNGAENAVYRIYGASSPAEGKILLDIGKVTLITRYSDPFDLTSDFEYNISVGNSVRVPLSYEENLSPIFVDVDDNLTTSVGSSITVRLSAEVAGDTDGNVVFEVRQVPRGASVENDGTVKWKPDSSQVGENLFAVDAVDSLGRRSTEYFTITVYGSTTGTRPENNDGDTSSNGAASEEISGGGGAATDNSENDVGTDDSDRSQDSNESGETSPDASGETDGIRFTDLFNHAWAADAINTLAADGIIKGTTVSTYSPANNITRADFALLLVRAFKLRSDNAENFADVSASDYFASELAVARNTGVVNGVGDNRFAPRNFITRQDMMVITYRALTNLGFEFKGGEVDYPDYALVAEYAKEAVAALISSGLVNGKNSIIVPTDYTTRAEVAVLIKRILDYIS